MNLTPFKKSYFWHDPFHGLGSLQNEMNKFLKPISKIMGREAGLFKRRWSPSIDVYDSDNELFVKVDIPGFKKEEIEVSIKDNILTIKGEKKGENEVHKENYYRAERFYGSFNRSVQLPSGVEHENASATYKDGVLELKLLKKEESKPKLISIDVN